MQNQQWLAIRFVALPLEALGIKHHALEPVCIIEKNRIYAANLLAKQHGVQHGMSTSHAKLMCDLNLLERDTNKEKIRLEQLAHWAYRYTSLVCFYHSDHHPLNCLVLELGGSQRLFKNQQQLFFRLSEDLKKMGVYVQFGQAKTAKAAYVQSANSESTNKGIRDFDQNFDSITVETLDISAKITQQLLQCGLSYLADLQPISKQQLNNRFSPALSIYLDQLFNRSADPLFTHGAPGHVIPPETFSSQLDFAEPISNRQWIDLEIENLLKRLVEFLTKRQWLCQSFSWLLIGERNKCLHNITVQLASKHTNLAIYKELTDLKMSNIELSQELYGIQLKSDRLIAQQLWVDDLFDSAQGQQEVAGLIDRLHSRLGDQQVFQLDYANEYLPEELNQLVAISEANQSPSMPLNQTASSETGSSKHDHQFSSSPIWLLAKPKRLAVKNQQPIYNSELHIIHGPQRLNERWWQSNLNISARDYFIARQQDGGLLWIFYQHQEKAWYLHGLYG